MFSNLSKTVSSITLATALFGCREERDISPATEVGSRERPLLVSLEQAREGAEGERVYLKDITLVPVASSQNTRSRASYEVVDKHGDRMLALLQAEPDSFLWQVAPGARERSYRDFGGIIHRESNQLTLSIFKLAN